MINKDVAGHADFKDIKEGAKQKVLERVKNYQDMMFAKQKRLQEQ